jgi:PAS domain S-box-containing protein
MMPSKSLFEGVGGLDAAPPPYRIRGSSDMRELTGPEGSAVPDSLLFEALLRSAPDAILISDEGGRIVTASAQVEQVFGYHPRELLGKPVESLLPVTLRPLHENHRASYYRSPSTRPMGKGLNLSAVRRDGAEFPAEISLSHLKTENGLLVMAIVRDVTERKAAEAQIEEERQRLQTLINISPVGIFVAAANGRVVLINHEAERLIGFGLATEDKLAGYVSAFVYRRADGSKYGPGELPLERALYGGETVYAENMTVEGAKNGSIPALVHAAPIYSADGKIDGAITVFQDMSPAAEADRLRDALARLEERERIQMDLHDSVIGSIYAATLQLEGCLDDAGVTPPATTTINEIIDRMHGVISEIRDHILRRETVFQSHRLHDALSQLLDSFMATTGLVGDLESPAEPPSLPDTQSAAAFHIVQEALNNAMKHAQPTRVIVRLADSRDHVSIEVIDDGVGFEVSLDQTTDHHGLRNMAERARGVGGTLSMRSVPGQGTTVILQFPVRSS